MTTKQGTPACNFCQAQQGNPSTAGWVHLPETPIDYCPACAAKPVTALLATYTPPQFRQVGPGMPGVPPAMNRTADPNAGATFPAGLAKPPGPPQPSGFAAQPSPQK